MALTSSGLTTLKLVLSADLGIITNIDNKKSLIGTGKYSTKKKLMLFQIYFELIDSYLFGNTESRNLITETEMGYLLKHLNYMFNKDYTLS